MKKILCTIIISLFILATANAQINQGSVFLGGSGYYNSNTVKEGSRLGNNIKDEGTGINIQVGKIVKNNSVAGIIVSYYYFNDHYPIPDSNFNKSNQYSAGIFYRKYKKLFRNFYFFGEADAVYMHSTTHNTVESYYDDTRTTSDGGTVSFVPGLSYAISKRFYIDLTMQNLVSLSYTHSTEKNMLGTPPATDNEETNSFSANINLNSNFLNNFGLGFKFIF